MWTFLSDNTCIISIVGIFVIPPIIASIREKIHRIKEERRYSRRLERCSERTSVTDLRSFNDEVANLQKVRDQEHVSSIPFSPPGDPARVDIEE